MTNLNYVENYNKENITEDEQKALSEMNHSEQFFYEGMRSEELPSQRFANIDKNTFRDE